LVVACAGPQFHFRRIGAEKRTNKQLTTNNIGGTR
jgi:hypothetical protein